MTLEHSKNKYKLEGGIDSSFLALIPKEKNPFMFHMFEHILCKVSYKIVSKIMASRLLDKLVS